MKKKISGLFALGMAMALTFGMTVCAAPSPSTNTAPVITEKVEIAADTTEPTEATEVETLKEEATTLTTVVGTVTATVEINDSIVAITVEAPKPVTAAVMKSAKTTATTITEKLVAEKKITVAENKVAVATPVAATDIEITLPEGVTEIPAGGISLTIPVTIQIDSSKTYLVLHLRKDGVWETIPATIVNGEIVATFTSLSPIVIVEVAQQDVADDDDDDDNTVTTTPAPEASAAVSPKTGEAVPFAATMAVVCLAGAAYCGRKAKKN